MQIKYSEIARKSFQENLNFLEKMWKKKEINLFLDDVQWVLSELARGNIQQYQKSQFNTRSALIGKKHVRMYFRQEENNIIILLFFAVRQNPQKIIDLLK